MARTAIDLVLILIFAITGRASHAEGLDLPGIATTAWPFLAAGLIGSLLARSLAKDRWLLEGTIVWATTLFGGMALRLLGGDTAAPAFVVVAAVTLALMLIGWRAVAALVRSRTA